MPWRSRMKGLACLLLSATFLGSLALEGNSQVQVLLVDGQSGGPYHNWKLTTPILQKELEETGLFQVTVLTAPASDGDFGNFHPEFSKYQVIVSNLDSPEWPENLRSQVERYISDGGGL